MGEITGWKSRSSLPSPRRLGCHQIKLSEEIERAKEERAPLMLQKKFESIPISVRQNCSACRRRDEVGADAPVLSVLGGILVPVTAAAVS